MLLHYFNIKENIDKKNAENIYLIIIKKIKFIIVDKEFDIKNNLNTSVQLTTIILICIFYGSKIGKNKKNKKINEELMKLFVSDLDHSLRLSGIGDMSIGKNVKFYVKKFYSQLKKLEHIFQNNNLKEFTKFLKSTDIIDEDLKLKDLSNFMFNNSVKLINNVKNNEVKNSNISIFFN